MPAVALQKVKGHGGAMIEIKSLNPHHRQLLISSGPRDLVKQLIAVDRSAYARQGEFDPVDGRLYLAWASAGLVDERDFQDWCAAGLPGAGRFGVLRDCSAFSVMTGEQSEWRLSARSAAAQ